MKSTGEVISDGGLKSKILNSQLSSVFTNADPENIPDTGSDPKPGLGPLIILDSSSLKTAVFIIT